MSYDWPPFENQGLFKIAERLQDMSDESYNDQPGTTHADGWKNVNTPLLRGPFVEAIDREAELLDTVRQEEWNRQLVQDGRRRIPVLKEGFLDSPKAVRTFSTGATRDTDDSKNDYEGFIDPDVLEAYGDYMTAHRKQSDGSLRDSDNWQKGIPKVAYVKSLLRHVMVVWKIHRGRPVRPEKVGGVYVPITMKDALCAVLFNTMGLIHEILKDEREGKAPSYPLKVAR